MFKTLKRLFKNEEGQALVLLALGLVVLLGFTAIAVDYGYLAWQRRNLQNAADSAALAAARELPNESQVESVAKTYAQKYAPKDTLLEIDSRRDPGNSNAVIVDVAHTYNTFFARVLGSNSERVSATATAEKIVTWEGEAIPFLNFAFDYSDEDTTGRFHVNTGQKGTILNFTIRNFGSPNLYFEIDYTNGIEVAPGQGNHHDENKNSLNDGLKQIIKEENEGRIFHQFSLRDDIIKSGEFTVNGGKKTISLDNLEDLKNNDVVDPKQLVLIEVEFIGAKYSNSSDIELAPTGRVYDLGFNVPGNPLPDFPTENLITNSNASKLIN